MTTIKLRRDTSANWTANNPVLATGEPGLETDTKKLKFGDGSTAWNSLSYATNGNTSGSISYNSLTDKPNLATVATSGSYNDLINTPTIPSLPSFTFPSGNGTSNQVLQSNGDGTTIWVTSPIPSQTGNSGKFLTTDGSSTSWASAGGGSSISQYWATFQFADLGLPSSSQQLRVDLIPIKDWGTGITLDSSNRSFVIPSGDWWIEISTMIFNNASGYQVHFQWIETDTGSIIIDDAQYPGAGVEFPGLTFKLSVDTSKKYQLRIWNQSNATDAYAFDNILFKITKLA